MAPRRNHSNSNSSIVVHQQQLHHHQQQQQQQQQHHHHQHLNQPASQVSPYYDGNSINDDDLPQLHLNLLNLSGSNMSPIHTTTANGGGGSATAMLATIGNTNTNNNNNAEKFYRCCQPYGECFKPEALISAGDQSSLADCVRVICNNENCQVGQYMHRACFEAWEQFLVMSMKTSGSRARAWTERQKAQNLWTKKGYELVYKSCGCKCGRGQLRKDVDWVAPLASSAMGGGASSPAHKQSNGSYGVTQQQQQQQRNGMNGAAGSPGEEDDKKKKKKRNRNSNSNSSNGTTAVNGSAKSMQQQNGGYAAMNGVQQPQQHQQHQLNGGALTNGSSNGGGDCSPTPNPNVGVIGSGLHHNNGNNGNGSNTGNSSNVAGGLLNSSNILGLNLRDRSRTLSSSSVGDGSGSTSPSDISHNSVDLMMSSMLQYQQHHPTLGLNAVNAGQHLQQLQQYQQQQQQQQANGLTKSILNGCVNGSQQLAKQQQAPQQNGSGSLLAASNGVGHLGLSSLDHQQFVQQQKVKQVELYSERVRITSGCNGIFSRRLDFSSFNSLPKTRLNSYQVKIEDEGNHGNDETRLFILSSLAQSQMSRVACILCEESMLVFDRYPLVDGSFFLSPKQHSTGCIEVKYEGRSLYLTCVCMRCLDGTSTSRIISCRFCGDIWDGSNLVLGTMYAYDIFAAMPCCAERLKCNNCFKLLLHPQHRLNFYSDYSHCVTCRFCSTQDTHFVKPLSYCYTKSSTVRHHPIA